MENIETVSLDLIHKIRLHINRTEKQAALLANRQKWGRLTSALYVLEDTSCAIEYYLKAEYPDDVGGKYLYTYGLLQALFVQEDAIDSLSYALFDKNIDFKNEYPKAYAVREMRNDVVGHPTHRGPNGCVYLAQYSLSEDYFYYSKDDSRKDISEIIDVDVREAVHETATCVNLILANSLDALDQEFKQYIEQHKDRKMKEIFNMLHYAKEKTLIPNVLGLWGYDATKNMVKKCEDELASRYGSVEAVDSYKYLLDEIHEIYGIVDKDIPTIAPDLQDRFQKYMLQTLFSKLEELERYCEETDDYFDNYGAEPEQAATTELPPIVIMDDIKNCSE